MDEHKKSHPSDDDAEMRVDRALSRRMLLARAAQAGVALSAAELAFGHGRALASSGASAPPKGLPKLPGGTPSRGGTFTLGVISNGSAENLYPGAAVATADFARNYNLYNLLFYLGPKITPLTPGLALSAEPNATATRWTFKLRDGVSWHDGKPFTADDLVYNFKTTWADPKHFGNGFLKDIVQFKNVRKRGRLIVEVPLRKPVPQFPTLFTHYVFGIMQSGATLQSTASKPVGTGPYVYESFEPGRRSSFKAFKDYWESGKPYVDELVINSSFTDNNTIFNALIGGQINLFPAIPAALARQQISSKDVQILQSVFASQTYQFVMRVDKGPLSDNRVRMAFKLLADRQALINGALSGFGNVAYDLLAPGTEYFASNLKRKQDVDRARALFKEAGVLGKTFTLPTANVLPGMVESATILAQQAEAAGVRVNVKTTSAATYFTAAGGFPGRPFAQDVVSPKASLTAAYQALLARGAPYPETNWGHQAGGEAKLDLIDAALKEPNPTRAAALWRRVQLQQFNEGGYLLWASVPNVDAAANNVRGLGSGPGFNYNNWRLCDGWLV